MEDSLRKSVYLAPMEILKKWISQRQNWGLTLAQLNIQFNDKFYKAHKSIYILFLSRTILKKAKQF